MYSAQETIAQLHGHLGNHHVVPRKRRTNSCSMVLYQRLLRDGWPEKGCRLYLHNCGAALESHGYQHQRYSPWYHCRLVTRQDLRSLVSFD